MNFQISSKFHAVYYIYIPPQKCVKLQQFETERDIQVLNGGVLFLYCFIFICYI